MTAAALMSRHTFAWQAATVHPFLAGVRDGSLPEQSFDRWLAQDYLFAQALVRAQSRIAATAPLADVALLAGGVVATVGESRSRNSSLGVAAILTVDLLPHQSVAGLQIPSRRGHAAMLGGPADNSARNRKVNCRKAKPGHSPEITRAGQGCASSAPARWWQPWCWGSFSGHLVCARHCAIPRRVIRGQSPSSCMRRRALDLPAAYGRARTAGAH